MSVLLNDDNNYYNTLSDSTQREKGTQVGGEGMRPNVLRASAGLVLVPGWHTQTHSANEEKECFDSPQGEVLQLWKPETEEGAQLGFSLRDVFSLATPNIVILEQGTFVSLFCTWRAPVLFDDSTAWSLSLDQLSQSLSYRWQRAARWGGPCARPRQAWARSSLCGEARAYSTLKPAQHNGPL